MTDVDLRAVHLSPTAPEEGNIDVTGTVKSGGVVLGAGGGGGGGGAGSDTTAVHRNAGHEAGSIDVDGATVGTVSPPISKVTPGAVLGGVNASVGDTQIAVITGAGTEYVLLPDSAAATAHLYAVTADTPTVDSALALSDASSRVTETLLLSPTLAVLLLSNSAPDPAPLFEVWDVSIASTPARRAVSSGAPADRPLYAAAVGTTIVGVTAAATVVTWDCSTPTAPVRAGSVALPATAGGPHGVRAAGTPNIVRALGASHVLIVDSAGNVYVVSVATPASPAVVGSSSVAGTTLLDAATSDDGQIAVVSQNDPDNDLLLLGLADPTTPVLIAAAISPDGLTPNGGVALVGDTAYLTLQGGIAAFALVGRTACTHVGTLAVAQGPNTVLPLAGGRAAVPCLDNVLRLATLPQQSVYVAQIGGAGITDGTVRGDWNVGGALTVHGNPVPEAGAIAAETITPDHTVILTIAGVNYKVPAVLA